MNLLSMHFIPVPGRALAADGGSESPVKSAWTSGCLVHPVNDRMAIDGWQDAGVTMAWIEHCSPNDPTHLWQPECPSTSKWATTIIWCSGSVGLPATDTPKIPTGIGGSLKITAFPAETYRIRRFCRAADGDGIHRGRGLRRASLRGGGHPKPGWYPSI